MKITIILETISLEEANFDANLLANLFEYIVERKLNVHTVTIIKNDSKVIDVCAQPFRKNIPRETYSMSKSFISLAIGIAENQDLLSLSDKVISYFPEKGDRSIKYIEDLNLEHLLTMSVGFDFQTNNNRIFFSSDWIETFLQTPIENKPGTKFDYNNYATYLLSAIIKKVTGLRARDYLYKNFFKKLEIKKPVWITRNGIDLGFYGLFLSVEDEEKIAYYLLNPEKFYENDILNETYFKKATSKQIETKRYPDLCQLNPDSGYGYQFWISKRYNGFNAWGMLGQTITVIPELSVSIILHCGDSRLNYLLDEFIIPACRKEYNGGIKKLNQALAKFEKPNYKEAFIPSKRINTFKFYDLKKNIDNLGTHEHYRIDSIGYKQTKDEFKLIIKKEEEIYQFNCGLNGEFIENRQQIYYMGEVMETYPCFRVTWKNEDQIYIEMQRLTIPWKSVLDIKFNNDNIEVIATYEKNGQGQSSETFYGQIDNNFDIDSYENSKDFI